jgi:GNAT superfamily N-acetyltransferase
VDIEVVPLTPDLQDAFRAVMACDGGWCQCVAWWVPTWDGWGDRTAEANRALRDALFARGEHDGYLALQAGRALGWCQVGPRDRLHKLVAQHGLEPDPEVWAVTCFKVLPEARGQGVARALLASVLTDLQRRGVRRVQAFPRAGEGHDASEVWTGPVRLFEGAGFRPVHTEGRRQVWERTSPLSVPDPG